MFQLNDPENDEEAVDQKQKRKCQTKESRKPKKDRGDVLC